MGTSAFILMKQEKYTPEKLLSDTIVAAFHADARLYFDNYKKYKNEQFLSGQSKVFKLKKPINQRRHWAQSAWSELFGLWLHADSGQTGEK